MLDKIRSNIESKRYSPKPFWKFITNVKDSFAKIFKGKTSTEKNRLTKEKQFYQQFIKKSSLVFDVGANHGQKSKTFLSLGARVVAIEPQKECIADLLENFNYHPNFTLVEKGLGDKAESKTMYISTNSDMASTFSKNWQESRFKDTVKWDHTETIQLTTIEELIKKFGRPTFCKIDVEGYEIEVIKGLKSKIDVIGFEFAEESLNNCLESINILEILGYSKFNFSKEESFRMEFNEWQSTSEFTTFLKEVCDPERKEFWGDIYCK